MVNGRIPMNKKPSRGSCNGHPSGAFRRLPAGRLAGCASGRSWLSNSRASRSRRSRSYAPYRRMAGRRVGTATRPLRLSALRALAASNSCPIAAINLGAAQHLHHVLRHARTNDFSGPSATRDSLRKQRYHLLESHGAMPLSSPEYCDL